MKKKIVHGEYAGQNSLHLATLLKNKEMVRLLVEGLPVGKRIDPREIMTEGRHQGSSALGLSIALYNAEFAKYYLKETPEVLRYTREQIQLEDALHLSVVTGLVELFPILLGELGLSIETKGNTGRYKHLTPLQLATVNRQLDMMKNLVGLGAIHRVIASEGKYTGYNLLGLIMLSPGDDTKSIEIIDYLMEDLGHSLEFSNQKSQNAVNLSIFTGQLEIFMHLVNKSDPEFSKFEEYTMLAANNNHGHIILKQLYSSELNLKFNKSSFPSPLDQAIQHGSLKNVEFLLSQGYMPSTVIVDGRYDGAVDYAKKKKDESPERAKIYELLAANEEKLEKLQFNKKEREKKTPKRFSYKNPSPSSCKKKSEENV